MRKPGDWYFPMSVKHEHNAILLNYQSITVLSLPLSFTLLEGRMEKKNSLKNNDKRAGRLSLLCFFLLSALLKNVSLNCKSHSPQPFNQLLTLVLLQHKTRKISNKTD